MFLQASVILSTVHAGMPERPGPGTPRTWHPPDLAHYPPPPPPGADTPLDQVPPGPGTPPARKQMPAYGQ